jgi:hypothetical protein
MRISFSFVKAFANWLESLGGPLPIGFITSSEIAYVDWPESARHPQPWKRCC